MKIKIAAFSIILVLSFLTACGGGSSSGNQTTTSTKGQAQGVYEGTTSAGYSFEAIVLPDDSFYAIYGTYSGDLLSITGLIYGTGKESGTNFSGSMTDFEYPGTPVGTATLSASFNAGSSLNGSLTEGSINETFSASAPSSSQFNYNTAASASAIAGTWTGSLMDGESADVTVDSSGNISGLSSAGCSFSGSAKPSASGKNFYNITLTFGGSPCVAAGQTATGVGVVALLADGTPQILAGLRDSGNTLATVFVGTPAP